MMNRATHLFTISLLAVGAAVPSGLAAQEKDVDSTAANTGRIVFPPSPNEPIVEWLAAIEKASDVASQKKKKRSKLKRILVGDTTNEPEPRLAAPTSIAIGPQETLFVVDEVLDAIVVINLQEHRFELFEGDGPAGLTDPVGVAIAEDGTLYVSDGATQAIYVFDANLRFRATFGGPDLFQRPTGLALSPDQNRLAVCDTPGNTVHILDAALGSVIESLGSDGGSSTGENFHFPYAVSYDAEGFLYVTDYLNFRVQVFDAAGDLELTFGQAGNRPGDMARPRGIVADSPNGVIYVVDGAFQVVQMFNLDGEILMWIGGSGTGPAEFWLPSGIARRGNLLAVGDTLNKRIQLFRFLGAPSP